MMIPKKCDTVLMLDTTSPTLSPKPSTLDPKPSFLDLTGGASASSDQGIPPLDDGTRTWAELVGLLDPMNESEQLIAPVVLESAMERLRGMNDAERRGVAINLVRFLAIFYAEILQMLHAAEHGDEAGLLQIGTSPRKNKGITHLKDGGEYQRTWRTKGRDGGQVESEEGRKEELREGQSDDGHPRSWMRVRADNYEEGFANEMFSLMQVGIDKFGVLLQKLLVLFEKMTRQVAAARAGFMKSMLADLQRPGTHINAAIVERMDRLQASRLKRKATLTYKKVIVSGAFNNGRS